MFLPWTFGILSIIIGEDKASITIKPEHYTELCLKGLSGWILLDFDGLTYFFYISHLYRALSHI